MMILSFLCGLCVGIAAIFAFEKVRARRREHQLALQVASFELLTDSQRAILRRVEDLRRKR